jgi:hypothetical protein
MSKSTLAENEFQFDRLLYWFLGYLVLASIAALFGFPARLFSNLGSAVPVNHFGALYLPRQQHLEVLIYSDDRNWNFSFILSFVLTGFVFSVACFIASIGGFVKKVALQSATLGTAKNAAALFLLGVGLMGVGFYYPFNDLACLTQGSCRDKQIGAVLALRSWLVLNATLLLAMYVATVLWVSRR